MYDVMVIGGGAAGVFAANAAVYKNSEARVALLEKSAVLLSKVKVSGGGRCNVTHACFDPSLLVQNYPRGGVELRGPFHRFGPKETIDWFEKRGVELKVESDGRMFPISDCSQTIIDCLVEESKKLGVEIFLRAKILDVLRVEGGFVVGAYACKKLILATGSGPDGHLWAEKLGHTIQKPVPSLFTFNVPTSKLKDLSGIAVDDVELMIEDTLLKQRGSLLITHFGFSGPAPLKLSAWGARELYEKNYRVRLCINWLPSMSKEAIFETLVALKKSSPQKQIVSENIFRFPKNLWKEFCRKLGRLNDISHKELDDLALLLNKDCYQVEGKTTHKEEFVTCGGVTLREVNFKTMESKICPGLYFAGEILDIDGVTGGFNFQNAWTTGYIAGNSSVDSLNLG